MKGPQGAAWYYIRAEPVGDSGQWVGTRLELELTETTRLTEDQYRDKRLVVLDGQKSGYLKIVNTTMGSMR